LKKENEKERSYKKTEITVLPLWMRRKKRNFSKYRRKVLSFWSQA
jgi:hypothetical protein